MTPQPTIEALLYELRAGVSVLGEEGARGRLSHCNKGAIREVVKRLQPGKGGKYDPNWNAEEIQLLIREWKKLTGRR